MLIGKRLLILKKIPLVLANFFESLDKCNFQLRFSSKRKHKNFTYLAYVKFFLLIFIEVSSWIFIAVECRMIYLV